MSLTTIHNNIIYLQNAIRHVRHNPSILSVQILPYRYTVACHGPVGIIGEGGNGLWKKISVAHTLKCSSGLVCLATCIKNTIFFLLKPQFASDTIRCSHNAFYHVVIVSGWSTSKLQPQTSRPRFSCWYLELSTVSLVVLDNCMQKILCYFHNVTLLSKV